ncbi:MAG: hypothetical protein WAN65_21225 [Candidatus Sulfotelmatobacter sp.]
MAQLIYCDNNFVISAHDAPEEYKDHLRELSSNCTVKFVFSPWHWREMANDRNHDRGKSMADFCDSLNSFWLFDRRSIQKKEVAAAFYQFAKLHAEPPQMVGDIGDIVYDYTGVHTYRKCSAFVEHLRQLGSNHPLEQTLKKALEDNARNAEDFNAGRFTKDLLSKTERLYVQTLLPSATQAGIVIDEKTKRDFLDSYTLNDLPATALETKITHENWALNRKLTENNFMDQQHIVAVPYVDVLITDDNKFSKLIKRAVDGVPFRTAEILSKAEFDIRFPKT